MLEERDEPFARRIRTTEAAAIAGVVYAALDLATSVILASVPALDDPRLVDWYNDAGNQDRLLLALNLTSISTVAFLWFVAVIRRRVGNREDQFFGTVFVGSGIVLIVSTLLATGAAISPVVASRLLEAGDLDASVISVTSGLGAAVALVIAPRMQAVFVFSTSTVILRSRALPVWLAWLGYVVGLVLFVVPFVIQPMGLVFPAWILVVSIVVLIARPTELADDDQPSLAADDHRAVLPHQDDS